MALDMAESSTRWEQRHTNFRKALGRLAMVVRLGQQRELNEFERDSMVKRFEFTFECAWRVMKSYAEEQGDMEVGASRDSIRRAFQLGLIDEPDTWMDMIRWRNETSHNYNGDIADIAITNISTVFFPLMMKFCNKMDNHSEAFANRLFTGEND